MRHKKINNKGIIVWKPDVSSMVGGTARSEVESFSNIKSLEAAERLLVKRNAENIITASWSGGVFFPK